MAHEADEGEWEAPLFHPWVNKSTEASLLEIRKWGSADGWNSQHSPKRRLPDGTVFHFGTFFPILFEEGHGNVLWKRQVPALDASHHLRQIISLPQNLVSSFVNWRRWTSSCGIHGWLSGILWVLWNHMQGFHKWAYLFFFSFFFQPKFFYGESPKLSSNSQQS